MYINVPRTLCDTLVEYPRSIAHSHALTIHAQLVLNNEKSSIIRFSLQNRQNRMKRQV